MRETCEIETGEHKRRNKRDCTRSKRTNTRSTKEGREGDIGTCTTKVQSGNCVLRETYRGRSRDKGHRGLSPTRVRSGSEVTTKEGPKRKTKETYYKVQTVTR